MDIDLKKLEYLLYHQRFYIETLIENVLEDSIENPHCSAVTTANLIKCYIDIEKNLGTTLPFVDVESFIKNIGFSNDDYLLFEQKREKEAVYYRGVQY